MFFKNIIGQTRIKTQLTQLVQHNRISHAQIFQGPQGSGKLALAIAFAQYLSCTNKQNGESCGTCPSCHKFNKLIHPDLHFVFPVVKLPGKDPTSDQFIAEWRKKILENPYFNLNDWLFTIGSENKQGIIYKDEAHAVIKKLSLKTYEADYKTMIIWLPEKMNMTAANKLLKIIEEPPSQTLFILISENYEDVMPTIRSRCIPIHIPAIEPSAIEDFLVKEKQVSESEARAISRLSRGNFIEALNHLETSDQRKDNLQLMQEWIGLLIKRDISRLVDWTEKLAGLGRERQKYFLIYSLRIFREMLVKLLKKEEMVYLLPEEDDLAKKLIPHIRFGRIFEISNEMEKAHYHIERNGSAKIILLDLSFKLIKWIKK